VGGVRKIPLPIVMPTISAVPPKNPMTRRRSCACGWTGVVNEGFSKAGTPYLVFRFTSAPQRISPQAA